jgi:type I restriction enzyme S subunit
VGKVGIAERPLCFSQDITAIQPDRARLDSDYLIQFLRASEAHFASRARGATIKGITREAVTSLKVPLPPIEEQRKIAAILDQADALRARRREALVLLDDLTQSIFIDMFGDPASSARPRPSRPLGALASIFRDGPFGSNLKTSHYVEHGVRVIRLQNIGVGKLIDDDAAFISEEHFASLSKHHCQPGDVLIGTLGDPNLRACLQPPSVPLALNKADCIQMRVDTKVATNHYVVGLLNQPGTLAVANSLVKGQTRARISMGRLRDLQVPVPPLEMQHEYGRRIQGVISSRSSAESAVEVVDSLFLSLQARAFSGRL